MCREGRGGRGGGRVFFDVRKQIECVSKEILSERERRGREERERREREERENGEKIRTIPKERSRIPR